MSTHACLIVTGRNQPTTLLHTSHTGMDVPKWIKQTVEVAAKERYYINSKEGAYKALKQDGSLSDWLGYTNNLANLIVAAAPMCLRIVGNYADLPKWGGQSHPYKLHINDDGTWTLIYEDGERIEQIDWQELFAEVCERQHLEGERFPVTMSEEENVAIRYILQTAGLVSAYLSSPFACHFGTKFFEKIGGKMTIPINEQSPVKEFYEKNERCKRCKKMHPKNNECAYCSQHNN